MGADDACKRCSYLIALKEDRIHNIYLYLLNKELFELKNGSSTL